MNYQEAHRKYKDLQEEKEDINKKLAGSIAN